MEWKFDSFSFKESAESHSQLVRRGRNPMDLAAATAELLLRAEGAPHLRVQDSDLLQWCCVTALVLVGSSFWLRRGS